MKLFFKALLLTLICLPFCQMMAEAKLLTHVQQDLLIKCLQELKAQGVTLAPKNQSLLIQHVQALENQGISPEQIITYCCAQAKQEQLALNDTQFYKNLLWTGAGCLVIAAVGIVAYMLFNKNDAPTIDAEESPEARDARWARIAHGNYNQDDVAVGFGNINRVMAYDPDPQLRAILGNVVIDPGRAAMPRLTDAELRAIPLETFHRAGHIVQENLIGWNQQRTVDDINMLIDRHMERAPEY